MMNKWGLPESDKAFHTCLLFYDDQYGIFVVINANK